MTLHELPRQVDVVGVPVAPLSMAEVVDTVLDWTTEDRVQVAVGVNAAVCNLAASDERFRALLLDSDLAYADGQSIVWAGKLLGLRMPERVATTDLVHPLLQACAVQGKRVFLFGGRPEVVAMAARRLQDAAPGLRIAFSHGYRPASDTEELLQEIHDFSTDVLLVGLGDPLQQEWIASVKGSLRVPAVLTCGGLFDWTSGARPRAPHWMIVTGLEWLWRLILEPRRLARRYLLGNPAFLARLAGQWLRARHRVNRR
ncbi:MAG: WecB/TagA/CpsF family glycosyltransferase [Actinomycetota bacterium]|nr:WecB/TagA/CpsF family glycosyltransferase [Actinomycetota bacterium]